MADVLLKLGLMALGISAILIGGAMAFFGSDVVANFFVSGLSLLSASDPITDLAAPNIESEFRFYAMMFVFYGGVLIQTARKLDLYAARVPILLAVFFLAGAARVKSYLEVGQPHDLFMGLMAIELGLPVLLFICWTLRKSTPPPPETVS